MQKWTMALLVAVIGIGIGIAVLSKTSIQAPSEGIQPQSLSSEPLATTPQQEPSSQMQAVEQAESASTSTAEEIRSTAGEVHPAEEVRSTVVEANQAQITSLTGEVEWLQAGSETWQSAALYQELGSGDKIRTGEDGRVSLSLDDGSTVELDPDSELSIQTLASDRATEARRSIFGIWQGKLIAKVTPVREGSTFQVETPTVTVRVPASGEDPSVTTTINPDGSVSVRSVEGPIDLLREGDFRMRTRLETGEEALVEYDPATGVLRVTSLVGTFDVIGPDDVPITLADGDTVVYSGGAATFIPGTPPVGDAPAAETIGEPVT